MLGMKITECQLWSALVPSMNLHHIVSIWVANVANSVTLAAVHNHC